MVGVFDSGVGGLSVVKHLLREFNSDIIYLGDTARLPYGTKSRDTVVKYSVNNVSFLVSQGVDVIVVACNTASSFAIDDLRERFDMPIFDVVEPAARIASGYSSVCVIGTEATVKSASYKSKIMRFNPETKVVEKACPLFVPLVEEGWIDKRVTIEVAEEYLSSMKCEALILGCTHYPLLKEIISTVLPGVELIDSAVALVKELRRKGVDLKGSGKLTFYTTDSPEKFSRMGRLFLGESFNGVHLVDL